MENKKSETPIPKILVLKPITPSRESERAKRLRYDDLEPLVDKYRPFEYRRLNKVFEAEAGGLKEADEARKLAMLYLLMGSVALQKAENKESVELWSDRYTASSGEIYGLPEPEIAQELNAEQVAGLEFGEKFKEASEKLGEYLEEKYGDVFRALDLDNAPDEIDPEQAADRFEAGIKMLTENFDAAWGEWNIKRDATKDLLSVEQQTKTLKIGMNRANMTPGELKKLFAHEVLIHMQRSINGAKKSESLRTGLAGYLDAEEGLGVFTEYALSGELKDIVIDRYVDIAWALGEVDGVKHTRAEMLERVTDRATERLRRRHGHKDPEDLEKEVYAHVNRIYRGSRGDKTIGVFTKDIAYYKGFLDIGRYIEGRLDSGDDIGVIFEYLTQGKFDPTNPAHVAYVEQA